MIIPPKMLRCWPVRLCLYWRLASWLGQLLHWGVCSLSRSDFHRRTLMVLVEVLAHVFSRSSRHQLPSPKAPKGSEGAHVLWWASSGVEGAFGRLQTQPPAIPSFSVRTPRALRASRSGLGVMPLAVASSDTSLAG